jgi:hypothetical protein
MMPISETKKYTPSDIASDCCYFNKNSSSVSFSSNKKSVATSIG